MKNQTKIMSYLISLKDIKKIKIKENEEKNIISIYLTLNNGKNNLQNFDQAYYAIKIVSVVRAILLYCYPTKKSYIHIH